MKELVLHSSLSQEEIDNNFRDIDFFSEMMDGLTEALAYSKGQAAADTFTRKRSLPDINVSEIRNSLHLTQKGFAAVLGVSPRTVESWEAGRTDPTPTAKKLIYLIQEDHNVIQKLMQA